MKNLCIIWALAFGVTSEASIKKQLIDLSEKMISHNKLLKEVSVPLRSSSKDLGIKPYAEYKDQGYIIFNDEFLYGSRLAKKTILENLPDSIVPIILTTSQSELKNNDIEKLFKAFLRGDKDRLKVLSVKAPKSVFYEGDPEQGDRDVAAEEPYGFWVRDHMPVPAFYSGTGESGFMVVDSRYYYGFEVDNQIATHFDAALIAHNYYFEGGNFTANESGECLVVNGEATAEIPDSIFELGYGCQKLIRLPYIKGIGHVDESAKFVSDKVILTDLIEYKEILEQHGYDVIMLPFPHGEKFDDYNYLNSVILDDTAFVPTYDAKEDSDAISVYQKLGYKVIPINSTQLIYDGVGAIHCMSMVYPKVNFLEFKSTIIRR